MNAVCDGEPAAPQQPALKPAKRHVYIAGPYSAGDPVVNTRRAMDVWDRLHDLGFIPICPHWSLFQHLLTPRKWDDWLQYDMEIISRCDAILRLPGESRGADLEEAFAAERGIPVVYTIDELIEVCA